MGDSSLSESVADTSCTAHGVSDSRDAALGHRCAEQTTDVERAAQEQADFDTRMQALPWRRRAGARAYGANVLVGAAQPLLEIGVALRSISVALPLEPLRRHLRTMIEAFVEDATRGGVDAETVVLARYCLCTFVDETVGATAWGGGAWAAKSLLVIFHGEASGGARFFTILHGLSQEPRRHLDALELLYLILSLGMAGRYRLIEGGGMELERVREKLRQLIRVERGAPPSALSMHWQVPPASQRSWWRGKVLGATLVVASLTLASLFVVLDYRLRTDADAAMNVLAAVHLPAVNGGAPAAPDETAGGLRHRLASLLAREVEEGLVSIGGTAGQAVITLRTDGVFASGSATVQPGDVVLIRRIGAALASTSGNVIVVGHTDDQPPLRATTSNWQLSLARATSVVNLLREEAGQSERFLAQGRGALEPVAPNDSPANRARNRRVVITVRESGVPL